MGIGHSAAYEIVNSVCKAITSHLVSRYISTQTDEVQLQEFMEASEGKKRFPQVIGVIDGYHIPISPEYDPDD